MAADYLFDNIILWRKDVVFDNKNVNLVFRISEYIPESSLHPQTYITGIHINNTV